MEPISSSRAGRASGKERKGGRGALERCSIRDNQQYLELELSDLVSPQGSLKASLPLRPRWGERRTSVTLQKVQSPVCVGQDFILFSVALARPLQSLIQTPHNVRMSRKKEPVGTLSSAIPKIEEDPKKGPTPPYSQCCWDE